MTNDGKNAIELINELFKSTATNFVLCGGDWLTNHKQSTAIEDLAYIDGLMDKLFPASYYPMLGNHDTNYQGELDGTDDTLANDGILSNQQLINLWFRKWGKMYYPFSGTATKFYVLDSGTDWDNTMTAYRWEQVDWLASQLLTGNDAHIVLAMHIVKNVATLQNFADNITKLAAAFNARTSITLNGQTYNFSGASGKVHCLLCGHTHTDWTDVVNDIPVFCVKNTQAGDFDLAVFDYGAGKLKTIRVGSNGANREMNLA